MLCAGGRCAPGVTVHGVARCNHREFGFTTSEEFELRVARLREMLRTPVVTLSASPPDGDPAPAPGPHPILEELGRFSHRVAISTDRLVGREAGQGRFRRTDDARGNRVRRLALAAAAFLRRFLLQVLPAGFV